MEQWEYTSQLQRKLDNLEQSWDVYISPLCCTYFHVRKPDPPHRDCKLKYNWVAIEQSLLPLAWYCEMSIDPFHRAFDEFWRVVVRHDASYRMPNHLHRTTISLEFHDDGSRRCTPPWGWGMFRSRVNSFEVCEYIAARKRQEGDQSKIMSQKKGCSTDAFDYSEACNCLEEWLLFRILQGKVV